MKYIGITFVILVAFVGLGLVSTALNIVTIPWLKLNSQVQTNRDIVTKTYNADNAIYNYHWFQERKASIDALDTTISQSESVLVSFETNAGARKDWTFEDKNEDARLRAVVQGQKAQYNNIVGEYNARAKEVDRNIFVDGLPLFFSLKPY